MKIVLSQKQQRQLGKLGVGVLYLIGSHAKNEAGPRSDIDFAVVMKNKKALQESEALYRALYELLSQHISNANKNRTAGQPMVIDIVFLDTAPLYYAIATRDDGKVLFEDSPSFRADFEERTTIRYADFEPLRQEQERVTLQMI
jgi:predicted nucleotidyltransferase